jgi:hypothetical protein
MRERHVGSELAARTGSRHTDEARRKMSEAQRRRGAWPPAAGRPSQPWEDALLGTMPDAEVATKTDRTSRAVYDRPRQLGITRWREPKP